MRSSLPRNVWMLGVVSLLTDAASEMCVPLFPLLLAGVGSGAEVLGLMEGAADTVSALIKWGSGRLSDRPAWRKPLVVAGYALAGATRPFYAWAGAAWHVVALRSTDRVGKGLRTAPRDALLADSVEPGRRAEAFGLHRAFDHAGAVLGPLVAALVLRDTRDLDVVRWVFVGAAVPGVLSVVALLLGVRDEASEGRAGGAAPSTERAQPGAWMLLVVTGWFAAFRLQEVLLLARLTMLGAPPVVLPLAWSAMHAVKTLTGRPLGALADRMGAERALPAGYAVYAATVALLGVATDAGWFAAAMGGFALHHGLTEGVEKALLSRRWPPSTRGKGFGVYHAMTALLALPSGYAQGWLLQHEGARVLMPVLATGAAIACALAALLLRPRRGAT